MIKLFYSAILFFVLIAPTQSFSLSSLSADSVLTNYSSTNVTTSSSLTLFSSVNHPVREVHVFDSSGQTMQLIITSGPYVTNVDIPPGGIDFTLKVTQGDSIALIALSSTANAGENITTLLY